MKKEENLEKFTLKIPEKNWSNLKNKFHYFTSQNEKPFKTQKKEIEKKIKTLLISSLSLIIFLLSVFSVQSATITSNVTETNMNSTVLLIGEGFSPNTVYYLIPLLEEKTAWWDGYKENWFFSPSSTNTTIFVTTNSTGGFSYNLYIPNDWRVAGGKLRFKVGEQLSSSLIWNTQGTNWAAILPPKTAITGDSNPDGFIYTISSSAAAGQGGFEKFFKSNGTLACRYNWTAGVINPNDMTNNGSIAYIVLSSTGNNLMRMNMADCNLIGLQQTAPGVSANTIRISPDNSYIIIGYAANNAPRKYMINVDPPVQNTTFNPSAISSSALDSCISPDGTRVFIGYANGNVTALNTHTGALIWNRDPPEEELKDPNYAFPVLSMDCDNERIYIGRGFVNFPTGIINQGFVEALWATNGSRAWINSKTDTVYDNQNNTEIRCDSNYCYVAKSTFPTPYIGVIGSAIFQINKTNGNVTWWNWRSYLPTTFNGAYGSGGTHSTLVSLWIDNESNGYLYPTYNNSWIQKLSKNDVNSEIIETNLWIRGLTNTWNFVADVPKNIWLSNETPYYNFRNWDQQGRPLSTNIINLNGTLLRYSMLSSFNSFSAFETPALFIDPVIQTSPTQRNEVQYFGGSSHASCGSSRYAPLFGWHYQDRACHYEEIPANLSGWNIGTTINGTFMSGVVYSLVKTKFWDYYPITKHYGKDNWAWAAMHNTTRNQVLGFATKFGEDQEDVYADIYGRAVLFANFFGTNPYYRPQFRADLNRKTDNYIFFLPKTPDPDNNIGENTMWRRVDIETQKIANPVEINLSQEETGSFNIEGFTFSNRINFTAREPNLFNRPNEPVEIVFNASSGIRTDCQDVIITDSSDNPISLWQVDNFTACSIGNNVSVWIMMNWTKNETKNLRLYYNSPSATPTPSGTTDLIVTTASGSCATNNHEIIINSTNWYFWQRPAAFDPANETTRFNFDNNENLWNTTTNHWRVAQCYKNSNTTGTGAGSSTDTCGAASSVVSRCLKVGGTGRIFAKLNATATVSAVPDRPSPANTINVEYQFFANTGRVRIRTQLAENRPMINTTVSKDWPPYYFFSCNGLIPGATGGSNSWIYYSGLYEQMKKPVATFNGDMTEANISSGPLPLMFTIKYGEFNNISQTEGRKIYRPSTLDGTKDFWDKGCTAHKIWLTYIYTGGRTYASAAPINVSEFISCHYSLSSELPKLGEGGYVNVIPEMDWDGTGINRWADSITRGKFYLMPNSFRPYNRENIYTPPYATNNPYATARISSYIIPVCPTKEYGYKGYDDFLVDLPNLIANKELHIKNNTKNIPCAAQIIKRTDSRGSDGINIIFARNLSVIVGETMSAGRTFPSNTFLPNSYSLKPDGELDLTFAQKGTTSFLTTGYYGKWYFTYTPENYIIDLFATSGNPQFLTPPGAASSYNIQYNWAPESYYNKHVFDETAFWNREIQNFTYYRNPCWLGRYNNIYGSTENGHPFLTTRSTPGWQHLTWGGANTCPRNHYNMETPDVFRPGWSSIYPTFDAVASWNELVIDGRMNFAGTGNPTEPGSNTFMIERHNSLFDYKHNDDFNSILQDIKDLNQEEKHPNKQPWYCQISRKTNKSFCVATSSSSSLIYNSNPGGGLLTNTNWSAYWSSARELSVFRNYFAPRFFDTSSWLFSFDHSLQINIYPSLSKSEVMLQNILYTSNDADDYSKFFQKQFPTAANSLQQTQFLLRDWKNSAFIVFDKDSRHYAAGLPMSLYGIAISNGEILINSNITLGIYDGENSLIQEIQTQTNSSGMFNWTLILPNNITSGLYYVRFNYNNTIIADTEFRVIGLVASITSDKAAYEQGQEVKTKITIKNSYTNIETDPDKLELRYLNPNGIVIECAKYPKEETIQGCEKNLTRIDEGIFTYNFSIENNPLGVYKQKVTLTEEGISADFKKDFVVALIDPCKPNGAYSYALNYPMEYNSTTDILTIIGNNSRGNLTNPITMEQIYEFAQATKGNCIVEKPAVGTYTIKSQLIIGNGTQEVYVSSKSESITFTTKKMPQLKINKKAHLSFGGISNGISQEGCSIKFNSNQTDDILLDVNGGEIAFYDSYVSDVGNHFGRFIYRGSCGNSEEEISEANSSITIKKTIFDKASRGQFFFTDNVTIDNMKINRINSSSIPGYGFVAGCSLPIINNLQIHNQEQNGSGIFVSNNTPANTNFIIQNSILSNNNKDVIANENGRGIQLINTEWNRKYGFQWSGTWEGKTNIRESYSYTPSFVDKADTPIENLTLVLINQYGNVKFHQITNKDGHTDELYVPTWEVEKTNESEIEKSFNPYTLYAKKYGNIFIKEQKTFTSKTSETKQINPNQFTTLSENLAKNIKNITYTPPTKVSHGEEVHTNWTTSGRLNNYPVDQCQYFALFADETKLSENSNYTINYGTGEITFMQNMSGKKITPVYFYGGNITITNGFTLSGSFTMNKIYDYLSYLTSKNNLSEDLTTIDGINYQFCVDFLIGNETQKGSVSDGNAKISFKEGYDLKFSGLGGFVDLAGITSGGGSSGGLPLNIFNSVGTSYSPGNTVYIFSTVLNERGQLAEASVELSIYLPNGTLYKKDNMNTTSTGRFEYKFVLPGDAQLGTWRANIDAKYGTAEVHDNLAFNVMNSNGGGGGSGTTPQIQLDAPNIIIINESFGLYVFTKNENNLLVNCDSGAYLTLKDILNNSIILNSVALTNLGAGKYNYTLSIPYKSTFLAEVSCSINSVNYISNPKIISTHEVPTNESRNTNSREMHPTISLLASTPIATSSSSAIGALVKNSTGEAKNCEDPLKVSIINLASGSIVSSGDMVNFGEGMYSYFWTTPPTPSVFYINASCRIEGKKYTGFSLISTQNIGVNNTIDYNQIAIYVWNFTSRNLTYYNQSIAENIQQCLKDNQCSGWWINTTLTNIQNTISILNSTTNQIKTNTETILSYLNCTSQNEICIKLQNILSNTTDIQTRVYSLNTTQIPLLQTYLNNIYNDTQYIKTNMATASALQEINLSLSWIKENTLTREIFDANITEIINRLNEINLTTKEINNFVNCTNTTNTTLCNYLRNINSTTTLIYSEMASYSQILNIESNISWIKENIATKEQINSNFTEVISRLTNINSTLSEVQTNLSNINNSLSNQILEIKNNTIWLINNIATQEQINNNFTTVLTKLNGINATITETNNYLYNQISNTLNQINTTTVETYSFLMNNLSITTNLTQILEKIDYLNNNLTYIKNNMFYQGNASGAFLLDYLATAYAERNSRAELWIYAKDLFGNKKTISSANCSIMKRKSHIATANSSTSSEGVYAYWDIPSTQESGEHYWNCTLAENTMSIYIPFFVSSNSRNFAITRLVSSSPKYPNENAIIEATFAEQTGSVEPDTINLTIYKPNYITIWHSANKNDFSLRNGIWSWTQMIESNPTTGTYYVHMTATYNNFTDSRTTQFRIATGGPYKVYLQCPTTATTGEILTCTIIIEDEGEAETESITTVWLDTNSNGIWNAGEPKMSFSKETKPLQNISETISLNIPSNHPTGMFVVRASTEYLNSGQPNSAASSSIIIQTKERPDESGRPSGGGGSTSPPTKYFEENKKTNLTSSDKNKENTELFQRNKIDIEVIILDDYKKVFAGSKIIARIILYNLGTEEAKNTLLTYCIKNIEEENIRCLNETLSIQTKTELLREFPIPENILAGKYYFEAFSNYKNTTSNSRAIFSIERNFQKEPQQENKYSENNLKTTKKNPIVFILLGLAAIITFLIILFILKKRKQNKQSKGQAINHKILNKTKEEDYYFEKQTEKQISLQKIRKIIEGKIMLTLLILIGLISLLGTLNIGRETLEFLLGEAVPNKFAIGIIYFTLLIISLSLIMLIHKKKIKDTLNFIEGKLAKEYPANSVKGLINKKVYTNSGDYIGKVDDIILGENKIDSLKIKLEAKQNFKFKRIVINWKQVTSCGENIIIDSKIMEALK